MAIENTRMKPPAMPGRLSGSTTLKNVRVRLAPRLIAADSRFGLMPLSEPMIVSTVYGSSACARPMMMAPVLGMKAMRSVDEAESEQHVVGDAEAVEDDVPAVGAHHHARQQRRQRQRDQQAFPSALRPHQEIGERITEHDVDQTDGEPDYERAREDLEIERAREQKAVVVERGFVGELLRLRLEKACRQQQRIGQDEKRQQHRRGHRNQQPVRRNTAALARLHRSRVAHRAKRAGRPSPSP